MGNCNSGGERMYSYTGVFKQKKSGYDLLEITEFIIDGKLFKPNEPIKFTITEEAEGWVYVRDDSLAIREGGKTQKEAIKEALLMAADNYEDLGFSEEKMTEDAKTLQKKFRNWEVYRIDQQAQ